MRADYLDIGGCRSFVLQEGEGVPVLLLHTAGQHGVQWRHVQGELASHGYRVVVPDLPGHGKSEPASGGPVRDLRTYAAWCAEVIDTLDLDRPFIVGCSIGGRISLDLAARMGDRLRGVIAMAAHGHRDSHPRLTEHGLERELVDSAAPSRADRTYFGTKAVVGASVSTETAELIALMHRREDPAVSTSDLIGWTRHDLGTDLDTIACPVHLVAGTDDLWVDPADVARTADRIPRSELTVLDGIGHYPMEEVSDFADTLHGWMKGLTDL
ncbi:alpha/beta fold hydrolase [Amycolatopsis palatopharyngis]|uniref:alpha/beta fold hydrolase n=1 Tax=Amycolatopsis palatopharyngis TaxID=187982 RepID=UPI000E252970|nr:alpha/beta hydrolase [Amycolatopsis palatopharyngis]